MNYVETLAYWYLRLNGFFPLSRFVLHSIPHTYVRGGRQIDSRYTSDCDLLGIRLPNSYEEIGGNYWDMDWGVFNPLQLNPVRKKVAFILEAKGGGTTKPDDAFARDHLERAVQRTGFFHYNDPALERALDRLNGHRFYEDDKRYILKILVVDTPEIPPQLKPLWLKISVSRIVAFVSERVRRYTEKTEAWNFFPSDLLQFLILHPPAPLDIPDPFENEPPFIENN